MQITLVKEPGTLNRTASEWSVLFGQHFEGNGATLAFQFRSVKGWTQNEFVDFSYISKADLRKETLWTKITVSKDTLASSSFTMIRCLKLNCFVSVLECYGTFETLETVLPPCLTWLTHCMVCWGKAFDPSRF